MPEINPSDWSPECSCGFDASGEVDTDGCVLHDLPLSGLLIGEEN